jgi:DNA polymerase-1
VYNAYDVFYTWHLYVLREKELAEAGEVTQAAFQRRMDVSKMFAIIERSHFTIDKAHLEKLKVILEEDFKVAREELVFIAGRELNPNSPKQIHEWFNERGMPLPKLKVKSGPDKGKLKPSTSADAMAIVIENAKAKYDDAALDFAEKLLELRGIVKNLGTYVNGFLDRAHGNQIRPTFNVTGPMTGRIANRGAGILTIPRDELYRQMIIPSGPERVLVKPDYGQLEMRLVAYYSGDPRFVAAFQPGMPDFFTAMMPEVYPDLDLSKLTKAEHKEKRNGVKPVSHGANYGRSYAAIAEQFKMPLAEAKAIYDRYMGDPNVGLIPWQNEIREKATTGEEIITDYGFHYQAEIVSEKNKNSVENSALAFIPQSTGNDITLGAAMTIQPQLAQYDAWLIATIHDQIIADSPIEHAKTVGALMEKAMLEEAQKVVKGVLIFEAEPEYGFNWAEIMNPAEWDTWLENNGYTA